jgi:dTDP-glucose 4,6-dehydratase
VADIEGLEIYPVDVTQPELLDTIEAIEPDAIFHLAAESHVTRGEHAAERFHKTNVVGTSRVFEAATRAGVGKVIHVSTDEVYGPCLSGAFDEAAKEAGDHQATSAYSKSKSLADDVAQSYMAKVPTAIARPANCYGPWQHPEKAIARWITRALQGDDLPVWGDGQQSRQWLYVEDACTALELLWKSDALGPVNVAGPPPSATNLEVATEIASIAGLAEGAAYLTEYDRPDHDRRYSLDPRKIGRLGWAPATDLGTGLGKTVAWFSSHREWWERLVADAEGLYRDREPRS